MMRQRGRTLGTFLLVWFGSDLLAAQDTLWTVSGDAADDLLGRYTSQLGDVNQDGYDDFIVGAPQPFLANTPGYARVFSGLDASTLYTFTGPTPHGLFGRAVGCAGDVNADGYSDIFVGEQLGGTQGFKAGSAYVYSGMDGSLLHAFHGDDVEDEFGVAVRGAGDIDQDGYDDLIVGSHLDDGAAVDAGVARVFSGCDGSLLHEFEGTAAGDWCGYEGAGAGDVDGDGYEDLVVGSPLADFNGGESGTVTVFSGLDGTTLHSFHGAVANDRLGWCVATAGDINQDGYADVMAGAPQLGTIKPGYVRVYSGLDGAQLYQFDGPDLLDQFGVTARNAGDVNGDGYPDVVIGSPGSDRGAADGGSVWLFSGEDGDLLYVFDGTSPGLFLGASVHSAGDVNKDGLADIVATLPGDTTQGSRSGSAKVFSGNDLFLFVDPRVVAAGDPQTLTTGVETPGQPVALFIVATDGVPQFTQVTPVAFFGGTGQWIIQHTVPNDPQLFGHTFCLQSLALSSGGLLVDTGAESVTFQ